MVTTLIAALALATSLSAEVPFVPQTDALCGGAAAAMVFRYWGDAHADVAQFASLVERRPGSRAGIANGVLADAIRQRGWQTESGGDSLAALRSHIGAGQPIIVLLGDRRDSFHYVVVTGVDDDVVVIHDPSWGPSRHVRESEFERLWAMSGHWSLLVLPITSVAQPFRAAAPEPAEELPLTPCDAVLDRAIDDVRARGLDSADEIFARVRAECPSAAGPYRELAGVRFAQKKWHDASHLAAQALSRQPDDAYALDVLGASRFMLDDASGALRAWNQIDKPRLDLVRIDGVRRSRYQTLTEAIGLTPGSLLTSDDFVRAKHRVDELPDRASARIAVRPEDDGYATVDVVIAERRGRPHGWMDWTGVAVRAGVDRELAIDVPGFTGQGEMWSASWRWWTNRPRVAAGFAAPRVGGLPGVWRIEGSWEVESYGASGAEQARPLRQSRTHGALSVSDWLRANLRYGITAGIDAWSAGTHAASIGGSLERRWSNDRVRVTGTATRWLPLGANAGFSVAALRAAVQSSPADAANTWQLSAAGGAERASEQAPMSLWAGAGDGHARVALLRAHPLLDDGVIDLGSRSVFGRSVQYASADAVRWLPRPQLLRVGIAAFADLARSTRSTSGKPDAAQLDLGGGLRLRVPGAGRVLRIDVAHGLRDGADALTIGWSF